VLLAIRPNFIIGHAWMAEEFRHENSKDTQQRFAEALEGVPLTFEPHDRFKDRVPPAIGLIRTGDTIQYANMIIESA
jgi:D-ribose pyranase